MLLVVITVDGVWGLCYEHSPSEGLAPVQLLEGILKKVDGDVNADEEEDVKEATSHVPPPEKLEWNLDGDLKRRITVASQTIDK